MFDCLKHKGKKNLLLKDTKNGKHIQEYITFIFQKQKNTFSFNGESVFIFYFLDFTFA